MYRELATHLQTLGSAGLQLVTEIVFPPTCAGCNCSGCWMCPMCREQLVELDWPAPGSIHSEARFQARFAYVEPIRRAIHLLKYERQYCRADWFADQLLPLVVSLNIADAVLEPVPLTKRRERQRGFNQAREIAQRLSEVSGVALGANLRRIRETRPQVELNGIERVTNVRGAFVADRDVAGKQVILIDDVITTGATMRECAVASLEAGATDVFGIAVASGAPQSTRQVLLPPLVEPNE